MKLEIAIVGTLVVVALIGSVAVCKVRADRFNKITGSKISWVDAMFLELRIDCNNQNRED